MWFLFVFAIFLIMELVGLYPCNFSLTAFILLILCWSECFACLSCSLLSHLLCDTFSFASCWSLCFFPSNSVQAYKSLGTKFCQKTYYTYTFLPILHNRMDTMDTRWNSWLRHCATSRNVAGSIPDGVIGIFHWHNPSGRTMAVGSTQPLTEMSTRNIFWEVKAAGA